MSSSLGSGSSKLLSKSLDCKSPSIWALLPGHDLDMPDPGLAKCKCRPVLLWAHLPFVCTVLPPYLHLGVHSSHACICSPADHGPAFFSPCASIYITKCLVCADMCCMRTQDLQPATVPDGYQRWTHQRRAGRQERTEGSPFSVITHTILEHMQKDESCELHVTGHR